MASPTQKELEVSVFERIGACSIDRRAHNVRYRQKQLHALHAFFRQHANTIYGLIAQISGCTHDESVLEFSMTMMTINELYGQLDFDGSPDLEYSVSRNRSNISCRTPHGIVLVRPGTHNVFFSIFSAVAAALAAGNCVILEMKSENSALASFLKTEFTALDQDVFAILPSVTDPKLLSKCFVVDQRIIASVPSNISQELSAQLTLAIVDRTSDVARAALAICAACCLFSGESPYAPDIVVVNEWVLEQFVKACIEELSSDSPNCSAAITALPIAGSSARDEGQITIFESQRCKLVFCGSWEGAGKSPKRTICITSTRGLVDSITKASNSGPLLAAYCFADLKTCNFLHQYLDSSTTFINDIPLSILIGPPKPMTALSPNHVDLRYDLDFMSKPRPVVISSERSSSLIPIKLSDYSPKAQRDGNEGRVSTLRRQALKQLKPINQHSGSGSGFFDQGIMTGLIAFVFPTVIFMGWASFKVVRFTLDHWKPWEKPL